MTIEQVIKLGNEITTPAMSLSESFSRIEIIGVLVIWMIGFLFLGSSQKFAGGIVAGVLTIGVAFLLTFSGGLVMAKASADKYDEDVEKWKTEVAIPYLEEQAKVQKEIIFMKIEAEMSHETTGTSLFGTGTIQSKEVQRTPMTISYKDVGIVTVTDWYETNMELTEGEEPYAEFYDIPVDLGHGLDAGVYGLKVFLPSDYKFTDIK